MIPLFARRAFAHLVSLPSCALALLVSASLPVASAAESTARDGPAPAAPTQVRVGAYLTSLYDLNGANNTFVADFWLWFVHPKDRALTPLKTVEPENARDFKPSLETVEEHGSERYHAQKVRGLFNHSWDVANFPFDRHELSIRLSEAQTETDELVYVADTANTSFDPAIVVDGWRLEQVSIATKPREYNSAFGVPGKAARSSYASAVVTIAVRRDALGIFIKLHAAVYIIFLVSLVSFLMDSSKDAFFTSRVGMLSGMVFAIVLNSQRIASTVGGGNAVTLPDKIHILTLFALLAALITVLVTRRIHAAGQSPRALRIDRLAGLWTLVLYALANAALIAAARYA
jgi:hypothetical protein